MIQGQAIGRLTFMGQNSPFQGSPFQGSQTQYSSVLQVLVFIDLAVQGTGKARA